MNIFVDESGDFSWRRPRCSVLTSLIILSRDLPDVCSRFGSWKRQIVGDSREELKGSTLTDQQLSSFVSAVFPAGDAHSKMLIVGVDTRVTQESAVSAVREQTAQMFALAKSRVEGANMDNKRLIQDYLEMPGWIKRRSNENALWIAALEETISQTVRLAVEAFADEHFDDEFADIEIEVDRCFVKDQRHIMFWKEWFRNGFSNRGHRAKHFSRPAAWKIRGHPFLQRYGRGAFLDFTDLFQSHMNFRDSEQVIGIQLADICAQIASRWLNGVGAFAAFESLLPRVIEQDGAAVRMLHIHPEHSIWKDSVGDHVRVRPAEQATN
jgi:hypothetical protein